MTLVTSSCGVDFAGEKREGFYVCVGSQVSVSPYAVSRKQDVHIGLEGSSGVNSRNGKDNKSNSDNNHDERRQDACW